MGCQSHIKRFISIDIKRVLTNSLANHASNMIRLMETNPYYYFDKIMSDIIKEKPQSQSINLEL